MSYRYYCSDKHYQRGWIDCHSCCPGVRKDQLSSFDIKGTSKEIRGCEGWEGWETNLTVGSAAIDSIWVAERVAGARAAGAGTTFSGHD